MSALEMDHHERMFEEIKLKLEQQLWRLHKDLKRSKLPISEINLIKYIVMEEIENCITGLHKRYDKFSENDCKEVNYIINYKKQVKELFDKFV